MSIAGFFKQFILSILKIIKALDKSGEISKAFDSLEKALADDEAPAEE